MLLFSTADRVLHGLQAAFFKVVVAFLCFLCGLWSGYILSFRVQHDSDPRSIPHMQER